MTQSVTTEGYVNGIREAWIAKYIISIDGVGEFEIKHNTREKGKFPIHINDYVKITIEVQNQ